MDTDTDRQDDTAFYTRLARLDSERVPASIAFIDEFVDVVV